DQTPENSDGASDAKAGEGRVSRKSERPETADRRESCEQHRFHYTRYVMLDITRLLPDEHEVDSVIHADGEYETEREHIEQIQMNVHQFHGSDNRPNAERECDNLD